MTPDRLLAQYDRVADAPDAVPRLRRFILDLAVRGKLIAQDPNDEPASELLKRIAKDKARLVKAGEIKKADAVVDLTDSGQGFSVPQGWAITSLQSVCTSVTDGDHLPPPKAETGIPFLVIGNIRGQRIDFEGSRFVPSQYYKALDPIRRPKGGDLLYTLVGSYGIPVIVRDDQPFCVQRHVGILRPSKLIDVNFLARAMESRLAFDQATAVATGIAQKTVPLSGLRGLLLPLPPLAEQHRIVTKVDTLMAICDRLEATRSERETTRDRLAATSLARLKAPDPDTFPNDACFVLDALPALTTRPDQIKRLREAILNLAVRGKLVPQDPNDEPASVQLKRITAEKARLGGGRSSRGRRSEGRERTNEFEFILPAGWALSTLGSVALKITDGAHQTPTYVGTGIPFVSVKDFSAGRLDLSSTRLITEEEHHVLYRRCDPKRGDILIGRIGTLGRAVLVDTDDEFSLFVSVGLIRFSRENIVPEFFRTLLNSPLVEREFDRIKIGGGTHTNKLNLSDLQTVALPLPPIAEQRRIVAKVDELMALCDRLEASLATTDDTRLRLLETLLAEALEPSAAPEPEAVRLTDAEVAQARQRRIAAMRLQEIEGNPLSTDQVAMFEMFEREAWTHERRRAYLLANATTRAAE